MLIWADHTKRVCEIIAKLNPHYLATGATPDYVETQMRLVAAQSSPESGGYVSTLGFVLSFCEIDRGIYVYPSVAHYVLESI